jgi:uncharacterized membrane protein
MLVFTHKPDGPVNEGNEQMAAKSFKKITASAVSKALGAAGFDAASWNRNTERVYTTGFIATNETWADQYVAISYEFAGRYRNLTDAELLEKGQKTDLMAEALERAGYHVEIAEGGYLKVKKEDTQRFSITLEDLTKEQLAQVQALIAKAAA